MPFFPRPLMIRGLNLWQFALRKLLRIIRYCLSPHKYTLKNLQCNRIKEEKLTKRLH